MSRSILKISLDGFMVANVLGPAQIRTRPCGLRVDPRAQIELSTAPSLRPSRVRQVGIHVERIARCFSTVRLLQHE